MNFEPKFDDQWIEEIEEITKMPLSGEERLKLVRVLQEVHHAGVARGKEIAAKRQ